MMKFYICKECNAIIEGIQGNTDTIVSSNSNYCELIPNTSDGAKEKHVPSVKQNGKQIEVSVGEIIHPMQEEHNIQWILLETENGCHRKNLKSNEEPKAVFFLNDDEKPVAAYSYCNLHGFWKKEL